MTEALSYIVLIPARLASTRLPNKPLADLAGKPMVVRVAEAAQRSAARRVVVATDAAEVVAACRAHGVETCLTRSDHPSGSDRLAEACQTLGLVGDDIVVNLQGDEPLMDPALLDACARQLAASPDCTMATVAHPILDVADWINPNVVKVVLTRQGRALYFSRAPIPWWRDRPAGDTTALSIPVLRHVGLYAYRAQALRAFPTLSVSPLEAIEMLEQLRVLWHGHSIAVHVCSEAPPGGVDTSEDLIRVQASFIQMHQ